MELGGITLSTDLHWVNQFGHSGVDGRMVRSRDNTPLVWEQSAGPREFDLVGSENTGTLKLSEIQALKALSAVVPGAVYVLIFNGETMNVRFRTWDQPVIEDSDPLGPREAMTGTDVYKNVRIKLMEV